MPPIYTMHRSINEMTSAEYMTPNRKLQITTQSKTSHSIIIKDVKNNYYIKHNLCKSLLCHKLSHLL